MKFPNPKDYPDCESYRRAFERYDTWWLQQNMAGTVVGIFLAALGIFFILIITTLP